MADDHFEQARVDATLHYQMLVARDKVRQLIAGSREAIATSHEAIARADERIGSALIRRRQ